MSVTAVLLACGLVMSGFLNGVVRISFIALCALYLAFRIRKIGTVIVWIVMSSLLMIMSAPQKTMLEPGIYTVTEVRNGYVIAESRNVSIVCHCADANVHDRINVEGFEEITGLKNLGLYSFADAMSARNIRYQADGEVAEHSYSVQSRLMNHFRNDETAMSVLYGIRDEESLLDCCSLPVLAALSGIESLGILFIERKRMRGITTALGALYGWLFGWKAGLLRWVLFRLVRLKVDDRLLAWAISVITFAFLLPQKVTSFSLILPAVLQLFNMLNVPHKKAVTTILLVSLQAGYFHTLNLVSLCGFALLRIYAGLMFFSIWLPFRIPLLKWDPTIPVNFNGAVFACMVAGLLRWCLSGQGKLLITTAAILLFSGPYLDPFFHVYMLDIGQGDCTLILEPFGRSAVMIDCGQNMYRDNVEKIVAPFLKSRQIRKLDYVVVTHEDFDHSGGVDRLCEEVEVEKIIRSGPEGELADEVPDVDYEFVNLLNDRTLTDENSRSLVSCFAYDGFSYLWTGDAGTEVEKQLINTYPNLTVNILKAGHHGSDTSSSAEFLDSVDSDLCLISVGANNRYGHPSPTVMHRLQSQQVDTFCTSTSGMVHVFSLHGLHMVETASGAIGLIE